MQPYLSGEHILMHWIWTNRRSHEDEARLAAVPAVIESLDLSFDDGEVVRAKVPLIEIEIDDEGRGPLTDNLIAPGVRGLVFSSKLRRTLEQAGVTNIQYFPCTLVDTADGSRNDDYQVANLVGKVACVDESGSDLERHPRSGEIEFVNSLALRDDAINGHKMFRVAEHTQIIAVDDAVKSACTKSQITGVQFFEPHDFSM